MTVSGPKRRKRRPTISRRAMGKYRTSSRRLVAVRRRTNTSANLLKYMMHDGRIPKIDAFQKMRPGTLVKVKSWLSYRKTKPIDRRRLSWRYARKVTGRLVRNDKLMFLERHPTLVEWYKFCVVGGGIVWIDIADNIGGLSKMRKPPKSV